MCKATITSTGQIAIPEALRERLALVAGTEVSISLEGDSIVVKRLTGKFPNWRTMRGMFSGGDSLTQALMEERAAELARENARINQSS